MFSIRLLPPVRRGSEGQRLGEIVVGGFREVFSCYPAGARVDDLPSVWRAELAALVRGERVALLRHDPRFAWVVYREGEECFVQQRLSIDGEFHGLLPRVVTTEDGAPVSEWPTSLAAICQYLDGELGAARQDRQEGGHRS
jgi:hypothetical protein